MLPTIFRLIGNGVPSLMQQRVMESLPKLSTR